MRKSSVWLAALALTVGTGIAPVSMAAAATYPTSQKAIQLNGSNLYQPYGFAFHGTTYMPIWYVMQLADALHIDNHWNGTSRVWSFTDADYQGPTVSDAKTSLATMQITVNGHTVFSGLPRIVYPDPKNGKLTSFIPVYFIMQVFKRIGIGNTWDGTTWSVNSTPLPSGAGVTGGSTGTSGSATTSGGNAGTAGSGTGTTALGGSSGGTGTGAGTGSTAVSGTSAGSTGTGAGTTGGNSTSGNATADSPPLLTDLSNQSWIGPIGQDGLPQLEGQTVPTLPLQNQATNDSAYWARASESFFVSAQTTNPSSSSGANPAFVEANPGQQLYLFAYDNARSITSGQTTWTVNSPDATITTDTQDTWTGANNNIQQTLGYFTASKPGIYTVQAINNGQYSVPLVIEIGLSSLHSLPFALPVDDTGILPLPTDLPTVQPQSDSNVTFDQYPAEGNWIPVSGTVSGVKMITVVLNGSTSADEWDYRLPVDSSGHFSALLESPFTGDVSVSLVPRYLTLMTNSSSTNFTYPIDYDLPVSGTAPSTQLESLLPSSAIDYNAYPQFTTMADALLENSPSLDTAIAAMSNYAAADITYNEAEDQPGAKYVFQDAMATWNARLGVCENIAQLSAALMRSVGIPVQTVGGYANSSWTKPNYTDTNPSDAHEWLQVWNGTDWQIMDPTWTAISDNSGLAYGITSEFTTDTTSIAATHAAQTDQIGTTMSQRKR